MKQKRDYSAIKLEFFQSDFDEVKSFLTDKWLTYSSERRSRTKWRTKDKQEYKDRILQRALERNIEKSAKELEIPIETLKKAKKFAISKIIKMMTEQDLSMNDIAKWLEKIKTELWEPEHVSANYNMNANKVEWLTEEESEALDVLFWKNAKK